MTSAEQAPSIIKFSSIQPGDLIRHTYNKTVTVARAAERKQRNAWGGACWVDEHGATVAIAGAEKVELLERLDALPTKMAVISVVWASEGRKQDNPLVLFNGEKWVSDGLSLTAGQLSGLISSWELVLS